MSDPNVTTQRQIQAIQIDLERLRKADVPPLYLPWTQRVLNPFPLASSGGVWGDQCLPWAVTALAFYCSAFVSTTNNGSNFWTIALGATPSGGTLAQVSTATSSSGVFVRLSSTTVVAPLTTDTDLFITLTATGTPGSIFLAPAVALLRTGN